VNALNSLAPTQIEMWVRPQPDAADSSLARQMDDVLWRTVDILASLAAIVILFPVLLLTALAVRMSSPGPVLFAHRRIGRDGKLFPCLKFRTMVIDSQERLEHILATDPIARAEWARDQKLRNDPRITPIGKFLRSSSLDELPQFFNVLFGQMSLVGPRPIVHAETVRYGRYLRHYCSVRPGITGLWQISGRNDVNYRRRIAMDVKYVKTRNIGVNFRILFLTVPSILAARGSY
jgi:exopolysaccharide production protein ExoY